MNTPQSKRNERSGHLAVAVIGCGAIGRLHAGAIVESPVARLQAVCDPDPQRRQVTAETFGCRGYPSVGELLAAEELDAVTVATPDHLHVEAASAAIRAGCAVFCEKPLAANLAEAEHLVALAAGRGVPLSVDYNRRYGFGYQQARRWFDEGRIGRLRYALIRVSDAVPPPHVARVPEVIFTTLLTHHFDLMRYFGGEVCQLSAQAADEGPGELLRSVAVTLKFRGGGVGTIVAGYRAGQTRTAEWMELGGERGAIEIEDVTRRATLTLADPDARQTLKPNHFASGDAFYETIVTHVQDFLSHIAAGEPPSVTPHDALASMRLAAAAVESLSLRKSIEIA